MFSILQKPQDSVNAEDLETLQNEIERRLVAVVTQKWELERELLAFNSTSPDSGNLQLRAPKLEPPEITSDGFKNSLFEQQSGNNGGAKGGSSGSNSGEDSVSSEGSIFSNLTSSTIIIANPQEPGSQATSVAGSIGGTKRSHKNNDRPSKRFRPNSSNSFNSTTGVIFNKRPHHSKHRSKIVPSKFRSSQEESRPPHKNQITRNDAPDKLWPFVEQFCATPTAEQITELEDMIEAADNNNDKEYFRVPALGKRDSTPRETPTKSSESGKTQKRSRSRNGEEVSGLGALTQRLVSSLIEEAEDPSEVMQHNSESEAPNKKRNSKSKGGKSLDINNAKNLERRIRQELEEYDILGQQDDIPYSSEEDEILRELLASQHELFTIQCENKELMRRLLKRAKKHVALQNERLKLEEANEDVIASYHRLIQAKQRKRNPTKKEKDAAWRSLKVHEAIFKKCDDLYLSNLNRGEI